ncbi:MAG: DNA/RNA non-specific endonuclease [Bacteroidales bacterium]|nr:DNA/RNA non-specific endonuclease [Bacteroidales bacterium]
MKRSVLYTVFAALALVACDPEDLNGLLPGDDPAQHQEQPGPEPVDTTETPAPVDTTVAPPVFEPVTIYYENFDASDSFSGFLSNSGWSNVSGEGVSAVSYDSWNGSIRNDNYGSAGNIGTYDGASGKCYARIYQNNNGVMGHLTVSGISPCGAKDFRLSFGAAQGSEVLKVEASEDGQEWTEIGYTFTQNYNHWGLASGTFSFAEVPDAICLQFTLVAGKDAYQYGANIDDLKLETAETQSSTVITTGGQTETGYRYPELPVFDTSNKDFYYNTLYTTTVRSGQHVRNFSFCYDTRRHNPVWVAFPMHSIYCEGSGRSKDENGNDPWMEYPDLPLSQQSIIWDIACDGYQYWSCECSLLGGNGMWTKGHLCMSSSRSGAGEEINLQTFYPVNIAPQSNSYAGIFSNIWSQTEDLHWQRGTQICQDTLYVVAGCYYETDDNVEYDACNYNKRSAYSKPCIIPTHQYKLLLRTRSGYTGKKVQDCTAGELKTIGFWMDAVIPSGSSADINDYAMSVSEIERITGLTFFPDIPAEAKNQCVPSDWGL